MRSVTLLVMLIAGGETSVLGAILGSVLVGFLPEWLRFVGDGYLAVFGIGVEPSLGLAPLVAEEVYARLADLARTRLTILLVEQNTAMALLVAARAHVLEHGGDRARRLLGRAAGPPAVEEVYLDA